MALTCCQLVKHGRYVAAHPWFDTGATIALGDAKKHHDDVGQLALVQSGAKRVGRVVEVLGSAESIHAVMRGLLAEEGLLGPVPAPGFATAFSGGYVASGPATASRQPRPVWPHGLALLPREGAGEVQTPLRLTDGADLRVGDRVWFRHAKAGEVMERFDRVHLVRGASIEETVPTYRGEGRNFG